MSRSTKKPYYTEQQKDKTGVVKQTKRSANRAIRDSETPQNGKSYRKYFNSWNISDWSFYCPEDKKVRRK